MDSREGAEAGPIEEPEMNTGAIDLDEILDKLMGPTCRPIKVIKFVLSTGQTHGANVQANKVLDKLMGPTCRPIKVIKFVLSTGQTHGANVQANKGSVSASDEISGEDVRVAEKLLMGKTQSESFPHELSQLSRGEVTERKSKLFTYSPYLDEQGIIRSDTRLQRLPNSSDEYVRPILLDAKHPVVQLMLRWYHTKTGHQGNPFILAELRARYIIIGAHKFLKKVRKFCPHCQRERAKTLQPQMGQLPPERTNPQRPSFRLHRRRLFRSYIRKGTQKYREKVRCAIYMSRD
uniref:Uncharacterized protein n=1 Tax=Lutzomyia longipalpis TaxID=7200 RepID=A0A1B0GIT5_LUTLO